MRKPTSRSIVFRNGTLYYDKGQFCRQDNSGNGFGHY